MTARRIGFVGIGLMGEAMVRRLLPGATIRRADAADALAVAICHAHHRGTKLAYAKGYAPA